MMTIKDLASRVQGNVLITVKALNENTLIEFQSQYWDMIKDDVINLYVDGLRFANKDEIIAFVGADNDNKPITEELMVETEAELYDAIRDDSFNRIRLACDIKMLNTLAVYDTTKTIDLANHTLSYGGRESAAVKVGEDGELTITGNGIVQGGVSAITVVDGGEVTLEDGAYICGTASDSICSSLIYVIHGKALINGGAFSNSDAHGVLLRVTNGSESAIECRGGKFIGADPAGHVADGCTVSIDNVDGVPVYTVVKQ